MKTIKVSMRFSPDIVTKPLTYHLIKDYDLEVNILNANVGLNKIGQLVADITGEEAKIEEGLKFLKEQGVDIRLFTRSIIWQEEGCVHCGACTAVCPTEALTMDKNSWSLTFNKEKCVVCELCVRTCPIKVMSVSI
ncbi:MAG TPA: 4Fe-4S binding protein [Clostridiaceae bacterium]|nr:4Fe-4S binding protein [Clostridiaceae bacterium]